MLPIALSVNVNGAEHRLDVRPWRTLLQVLRDDLKLVGAREGCGVGVCGACTVLLDGQPISACLLPAAFADGRSLRTIEGLESEDGRLHPVQEAFLEHTAFQCSFCTPGFVLATVALLEELPDASEEQAREYLAGNLCRCGSYVNILRAVLAARDHLRAGS